MKKNLTAGTLSPSGFKRQGYYRAILVIVTAILLSFSSVTAQVADTIRTDQDSVSVIEKSKASASVPVLYGEQLKSRLLQSAFTIYTNQLTTTPSPQFLQALPGRIPGLNITFSSGGPGLDGNGMGFNIRGARAQIILIDG